MNTFNPPCKPGWLVWEEHILREQEALEQLEGKMVHATTPPQCRPVGWQRLERKRQRAAQLTARR